MSNEYKFTDEILLLMIEKDLSGKWREFADLLNSMDIPSPTGKEWTNNRLRKFVNRIMKKITARENREMDSKPPHEEKPQQEPEPQQVPGARAGDTEASDTGQYALDRLTPEFIEELERMVEWWRQEQATPIEDAGKKRPKFKRGKHTTTRTVRLGNELIKDAEKYAEGHKAETGGTFSSFVELLLWERLGRKSKHIIKEKESDRPVDTTSILV